MLYNYTYVPSNIEKLHGFIEHTVIKVWCNPSGAFAITKLHKDFRSIVVAVSQNKNDYLLQPITDIYNICKGLGKKDLKKIATGFKNNNAIVELCEGQLTPLFYADLKAIDKKLATLISSFCTNLYKHVLGLKSVYDYTASVKDYNAHFLTNNKKGKCPFCGLHDMQAIDNTKRDDYDHYLPKHKYPFSSINFQNLPPTCDKCNKAYKGSNDPIYHKNGKRRRAFFPFDKKAHSLTVEVKITSSTPTNMAKKDVSIKVKCAQKQKEVDTWLKIYGIEERYREKLRDAEAQHWIRECTDDAANYGISIDKYIAIQKGNLKLGDTRLYHYNFLRVPFLEECNRKKLL